MTGLGMERRVVTILFADVADSTGLGQRLDPEQLREVMQAYFVSMREEIEAEGGTVEKFIGDAVMAVFGFQWRTRTTPRGRCERPCGCALGWRASTASSRRATP